LIRIGAVVRLGIAFLSGKESAPRVSILQNAYQTDYQIIMARGVVASIPVLLVFILAQKYVIRGASRSGLKG
jgi:multiple sugar transport system permease protein